VRRVGTPADVGHAAVFLMTNPYVTGTVIEVSRRASRRLGFLIALPLRARRTADKVHRLRHGQRFAEAGVQRRYQRI
jgi:predicted NAD/FAD-binding protein